jgi:hypothetical protein
MTIPVCRVTSRDHPTTDGTRTVTYAQIAEQRAKGWPDFHPEDYCHRCGHPNMCWFTQSDLWNAVVRDGGNEAWKTKGEILCPQCFAELAGRRFGTGAWELVPSPPPGRGDA